MFEKLKETVCNANRELFDSNLVIYTWGNVSEIDTTSNCMAIKPSGVSYAEMTSEDIVVVDVVDGEIVEGRRNPSSDTPTHLEIYRAFPEVKGIAHTHSTYATSFAQAGKNIPYLGTTHADYFFGDIPCTRSLTEEEVSEGYEYHTGRVIVETFRATEIDPLNIPGVLVRNHGVFTWGKNAKEAVHNAVVLEEIAKMALMTTFLNKNSELPYYILDKHFSRKHGLKAYYGQSTLS